MSESQKKTVVVIEGDGIGPEVTPWAVEAIETAIKGAYGSTEAVAWEHRPAGKKAMEETGSPLPSETVDAIRTHGLGLKGPVETPVGGGIRSVNVALRKTLDLYACVRPVKYYKGVTAPVAKPENVDVVIFRENIEDVYAGIEWKSGTPEADKVIEFLKKEMGIEVRQGSGLGVKPMSAFGTKRLVKRAIEYTRDTGRESLTLVHKGNIMKFTEGAFRDWGYEAAKDEYADIAVRESEMAVGQSAGEGKFIIKDRIADAMFQEMLLRPERYDVLALPNLNGDYMSDAAAAQVGGIGIAPGANIGDEAAVFEATHGTAPDIAGQGKANPSSLILSGVMMLRHMGMVEAADRLEGGIARLLASGRMTIDLASAAGLGKALSTTEYSKALIAEIS